MPGMRRARRQAMRAMGPAPTPRARGAGAALLGAVAMGAVAIGAVAIGRLAIRQLGVRRAHFDELSIGTLTVDRLIIVEREQQ
jgi:anti-sigma factor RsiW